MKERLATVPVIGWLLRVQERFGEIRGTALANGIALQAFLSIIPLVIVVISLLGFLSAGDPDFASSLTDDLELSGEAADNLEEAVANAEDSRRAASVIGFGGLVLSGLGVIGAVQRSIDAAWQSHGSGVKDKLLAIGWLLGAFVIFAGSFALSVLLNFLPGVLAPLSIVAGLAVNVALFLFTFTLLGRLHVGWRARLPGAIACAIGFEVLKVVGSVYVPKLIADSSALYGSLGVVFAMLAWLTFFGRLLVYGSVINVLHWEDHHGTLSVPIEVPRVAEAIALGVNRTGAVVDRAEPDED